MWKHPSFLYQSCICMSLWKQASNYFEIWLGSPPPQFHSPPTQKNCPSFGELSLPHSSSAGETITIQDWVCGPGLPYLVQNVVPQMGMWPKRELRVLILEIIYEYLKKTTLSLLKSLSRDNRSLELSDPRPTEKTAICIGEEEADIEKQKVEKRQIRRKKGGTLAGSSGVSWAFDMYSTPGLYESINPFLMKLLWFGFFCPLWLKES